MLTLRLKTSSIADSSCQQLQKREPTTANEWSRGRVTISPRPPLFWTTSHASLANLSAVRVYFVEFALWIGPEWAVGDRTNIKAWQLIQHFLMNKRARIYRPLSLRQGKKLENWSRMSEIRYTPEDSVLSASFKSKIHHLGDAGTMNNLEKIT